MAGTSLDRSNRSKIQYGNGIPISATRGNIYIDIDSHQLYFKYGSTWISTSDLSIDLDEAYNEGSSITVDSGSINLTSPDNSNNNVLAIVQNDTTNNKAGLTISANTTSSSTDSDFSIGGESILLDGTNTTKIIRSNDNLLIGSMYSSEDTAAFIKFTAETDYAPFVDILSKKNHSDYSDSSATTVRIRSVNNAHGQGIVSLIATGSTYNSQLGIVNLTADNFNINSATLFNDPYISGASDWTNPIPLISSSSEIDDAYTLLGDTEGSLLALILTASADTTYSDGTGLDLTGTVFSLDHLGIQNLTDPGADRLLGWDQSAGASAWFSLTGLSFTGTSVVAELNHLNDVAVHSTIPADGNVIAWDDGAGKWNLADTITSSNHDPGSSIFASWNLGSTGSTGLGGGWYLSNNTGGYTLSELGTDDTIYSGGGYGYYAISAGTYSGLLYSSIHVSSDGVYFLTPTINNWSTWASNKFHVCASTYETASLYGLGPSTAPANSGIGEADSEKSIMSGILAAAYVPATSVAYGDSNGFQTGDVSKLSFTSVLGQNLLLCGVIGMLSDGTDGTLVSAGKLKLDDGYRTSSTWSDGLVIADSAAEWSALKAALGSEMSLVAALTATASGGSLQTAYDNGRAIAIGANNTPVTITVPSDYTGSCLALTNSRTSNATELVNIYNDCGWTSSVEPYGIFFQGDAGDIEGQLYTSLGHRIWTNDGCISVGKSVNTSSYASRSFYRSYLSGIESSDHRNIAEVCATTVDQSTDISAYIRVGVDYSAANTPYTFLDMSAGTGVLTLSGSSIYCNDRTVTNIKNASFDDDVDTLTPSLGVVAFNAATGSPGGHISTSSDITTFNVTRPVGHGAGVIITILADGDDIDVGGMSGCFFDEDTEDTFVLWPESGNNPDVGAVTISDGYIGVISLNWRKTSSGNLLCVGHFGIHVEAVPVI